MQSSISTALLLIVSAHGVSIEIKPNPSMVVKFTENRNRFHVNELGPNSGTVS